MIFIQVLIVLFMMNTTIGLTILTALGSFFEGLINVSKAGINFVLEIYKIKMALRSF